VVTKRTILRRFQISDLDNICELESDPEIMRFTPMAVGLSREQSLERLQKTVSLNAEREPLGIWAAETHDGDFIGWFMLIKTKYEYPELGCMIVRRQWRKGYAEEICQRLIEFGFELEYPKVVAVTNPQNVASEKMLAKLGFKLVKKVPYEDKVHNKTFDLNYWEIEK
jgi:RimJ/RimL family protein N-acetyltransferase